MPELKDTELRVLLVILRLTTGWNREGRFTVVPYRSLKRLTGRESEAVSKALRSLSDRGLIHIDKDPVLPNLPKTKPNRFAIRTTYKQKK